MVDPSLVDMILRVCRQETFLHANERYCRLFINKCTCFAFFHALALRFMLSWLVPSPFQIKYKPLLSAKKLLCD